MIAEPANIPPPVIEPAISGRLGSNGWYTSDVVLIWSVTPLSGITSMSGCERVTITSDTPGATFTCTATNAGGTTSKSVTIKRNATPPAITVLRTPGPNANGWNNTDVTVTFTASALSGIAAFSSPVTLSAEGANQAVTGVATDLAGFSASVTVVVNIDKTPPEAFTQFGPVKQELQVFGRDALSGTSANPFAPISVVRARREDQDDEEEEGPELRTYRVEDQAGNTLVLVERVAREEQEIKARVVSTQYNGGSVLAAPRNRASFEWDLNKDGSLKELEQKLQIRAVERRQEIEAEFQARKNRTIIKQEGPKPDTKGSLKNKLYSRYESC